MPARTMMMTQTTTTTTTTNNNNSAAASTAARAARSSSSSSSAQPQVVLRDGGLNDARTWYNRRLGCELDALLHQTLRQQHGSLPKAAIDMGVEEFVPDAPAFARRLCGERFVVSFAGAEDALPPHLRFLAALQFVQTGNHNISTLTPAYSATDPRDGAVYSLYDHAILDPDCASNDTGAAPPVFKLGIWMLARDYTETYHHNRLLQQPRLLEELQLPLPSPPRQAETTTRTASLHMQVLLCGHKHTGAHQDRAPVCPLCPWACPCLVDEWYDEATQTRLTLPAARLGHACAKVETLLTYTVMQRRLRQQPPPPPQPQQQPPRADKKKKKKNNTNNNTDLNAVLALLDGPGLASVFDAVYQAEGDADRALCPVVPVTARLLRCGALSGYFADLQHEYRVGWLHTSADGGVIVEGGGGGEADEVHDQAARRILVANPHAVLSLFARAFLGGGGGGGGAAEAEAEEEADRASATAVLACALAGAREAAAEEADDDDDDARAADLARFYELMRVTLNDQLLRVLVYPYSESSEPCFHLPEHFIHDLMDPARRARVLPLQRQRGRLPFPDSLTAVQRADLALAEERNWRFARAGRRPPCLLLLTDAQLALCTPDCLAPTSLTMPPQQQQGPRNHPYRAGLLNPPRRSGQRHAEVVPSASMAATHAELTDRELASTVMPPRPRLPPTLLLRSSAYAAASAAAAAAEEAEAEADDDDDDMMVVVPLLLQPAAASASSSSSSGSSTPPEPLQPQPQQQRAASSTKSKNNHRTKAQRKAATRARLLAQAEQAEQASLVEALRLSTLEAEARAIAEAEAAVAEALRFAAAAEARAAASAAEADAEAAVQALLRLLPSQPPPLRDAAIARLLRADAALWQPLLLQAQVEPDCVGIDAACVMCLDPLDLTAAFPSTAACCAASRSLLCNGCLLALRDRHRVAKALRADRKQQRDALAAKLREPEFKPKQLPPALTADDDAIDAQLALPPCVCAGAQHLFEPDAWRLATEWVGLRWLAARVDFNA